MPVSKSADAHLTLTIAYPVGIAYNDGSKD